MSAISEKTQHKWERRLRSFWVVGGLVFIGSILVARPLTESFETMRWFIPFAIVSLFSALAMSGFIWLMLQIALAHRERDEAARSRPVGVR